MSERSRLERSLSIFTEVRQGEGISALALTLNVFLLLSAYYVIKPVREALILAGGGAEIKSYAAIGQALLLALVVVPIYSKVASRVGRRALTNGLTLFFAAHLLGFYFLAKTSIPLGVAFFLWVGIFNIVIVAQFWSFAADLYQREQGERLFVLLAFGASAGAVSGSWVTGRLLDWVAIPELMLVAIALLVASLALFNWVAAREGPESLEPAQAEAAAPRGGFRLVLGNRYLLLVALSALFLNWVNTNGEYILGRVVEAAAHEAVASGTSESAKVFIGRFYSDFFTGVNALGLLLQLFVVSRILRHAKLPIAIVLLPLLSLGAYALLVFHPALGIVRWAKTAENATAYSLHNTARNALFLPTTREEKYKAKQVVDTFVVRIGDVLSALLVFVGVEWLAFETPHFAMVNALLAAAWVAVAIQVGRSYAALAAERDTLRNA